MGSTGIAFAKGSEKSNLKGTLLEELFTTVQTASAAVAQGLVAFLAAADYA